MSENSPYIFGFLDNSGDVYDYHIADNLKDDLTWDTIEFRFSLPYSKYIIIWKSNGQKLSKDEATSLVKFVQKDMKDYMFDMMMSNPTLKVGTDGTQTKIKEKLLPSRDFLIISYDIMKLPCKMDDCVNNWNNFARDTKMQVLEKLDKPQYNHQIEETAMEIVGKENPINPYVWNYEFRNVPYSGFELPSDDTLKTVFQKIKESDFEKGAQSLSNFYDISIPLVSIETEPLEIEYDLDEEPEDLDRACAEYDSVQSTIILASDVLDSFMLRLPAFLMAYFSHLALAKNWKFDVPAEQAGMFEREESEEFAYEFIRKLIELGLDPRED